MNAHHKSDGAYRGFVCIDMLLGVLFTQCYCVSMGGSMGGMVCLFSGGGEVNW